VPAKNCNNDEIEGIIMNIRQVDTGSNLKTDQLQTAATPTNNGGQQETIDDADLESLKVSQDFVAAAGVKKALLSVPVKRPEKIWWVRVHPSESHRGDYAVLELKERVASELYLVSADLRNVLCTEVTFRYVRLFTAITREGTLFLWYCRLPRPRRCV
jgi:hypothetical protein